MTQAPPERRPRLAVFCSGGGRSLQNLIDRSSRRGAESARLDAEIAAVVASRPCGAEERADAAGLALVRAYGRVEPDRLRDLVAEHAVDLVVLAGYLRLLPVPAELRGRVINIHPALLPPLGRAEFGGRGMHGLAVHWRVLEAFHAGEVTRSGCTVHHASDEYDTGEVVLQRSCPIEPGDTPATLAARVFDLELDALPDAIRTVLGR
ncbi:MAG: formyltransferase family protein [Planctomycetota bacterium]